MKLSLFTLCLLVLLNTRALHAQLHIPGFLTKTVSADSVKRQIGQIMNELESGHPGVYRYTPRQTFTAYIDSVKSGLHGNVTSLEHYLILKRIIAKVGCLHTGISLKKELKESIDKETYLLPLQLYFEDGKAYITRNYSENKAIPTGAEVLSVNGQPIPGLIEKLFDLIPSDAHTRSLKYRALYYQFPLWYRYLDFSDSFTITAKDSLGAINKYKLQGRKYADIAVDGFLKEPQLNKQLEFNTRGSAGIFTIHTFAKTQIKAAGQDFKKFTDSVFSELRKQNIGKLIVDLRDNTGGSDPNAVYFTRHFFDGSFRYGERTEVTGHIAGQIKGVYRLFFRKPVQKDSVWLWRDGIVKDLNTYPLVKPARNKYTGKTYVLINGFTMSSAANVAAVLHHNRKAVFIGEETGGGYRGNTSGMMPEVTLGDYVLTVPLQGYYLAVDPAAGRGGTVPEFMVRPTVKDLINGKDTVMEFAIQTANKD